MNQHPQSNCKMLHNPSIPLFWRIVFTTGWFLDVSRRRGSVTRRGFAPSVPLHVSRPSISHLWHRPSYLAARFARPTTRPTLLIQYSLFSAPCVFPRLGSESLPATYLGLVAPYSDLQCQEHTVQTLCQGGISASYDCSSHGSS